MKIIAEKVSSKVVAEVGDIALTETTYKLKGLSRSELKSIIEDMTQSEEERKIAQILLDAFHNNDQF